MRKHTIDYTSPQLATDHISSHKAIVAYLTSINLPASASALRQDLNIGDSFDDATSKRYEGLLEKKWTSVVRLQKKVRLEKLKQLLESALICEDNGLGITKHCPPIRT